MKNLLLMTILIMVGMPALLAGEEDYNIGEIKSIRSVVLNEERHVINGHVE